MNKKVERYLRIAAIVLIFLSLSSDRNPIFNYIMPIIIVGLLGYMIIKSDVFSNHEKGSTKMKTYQYLSVISLIVYLIVYILYLFNLDGSIKEYSATRVIFIVMIAVFGNLAPRIPFNRTLGLRLPWTVSNEETWRYAHRIIGYFSFPCIILLIIALYIQSDILYFSIIMLWVIIPSILSLIFHKKVES